MGAPSCNGCTQFSVRNLRSAARLRTDYAPSQLGVFGRHMGGDDDTRPRGYELYRRRCNTRLGCSRFVVKTKPEGAEPYSLRGATEAHESHIWLVQPH